MPKGMKAIAESSARGIQSIGDAAGFVVRRKTGRSEFGFAVFFVRLAEAGGRRASVARKTRGPEEG